MGESFIRAGREAPQLARAGQPGESASQPASQPVSSVASEAQPAKRGRWMASQSVLQPAKLLDSQIFGIP